MKEGWRIRQIQEIHPPGECALVCEDAATSALVFFHIVDLEGTQAVLQPLSQHITDKNREGLTKGDPIAAYRSVMCYQQSEHSYRQVGIALRQSGSLDFYYDFKLVESSAAVPGERVYTAIDSDFTDLHFKCWEKSDDPENSYEKVVWYVCRTSWKQRVGILSSTPREEEGIEEVRRRFKKKLKGI